LEISENALMQNTEATIRKLHQLHALGVRLAVDDFGAGYTSLSHVQRFPLDILKIDKSFIRGVETDSRQSSLVHAIIALGRALDLEIVAEGVDLATQVERLRQLGCDQGQGCHFAKPLSSYEMELLLKVRAPLAARRARSVPSTSR